MTAIPLRLDLGGWALLVTLSVLWGGSFFFVKIAVAEIAPPVLVFLRVAIAALTLHVVLFAMGRASPLASRGFGALVLLGLVNNVIPFSLIFWAQQSLDAGLAAIINATTPIFTMLLAALATTDERLTPAKLFGVALGLGGVAVMIGVKAIAGVEGHVLPALAMLGASTSYAVSAIYARRLVAVDPLTMAAGQLTGSTLLMGALLAAGAVSGLAAPVPPALPGAAALAAVLALAVVSTAFAYLIYFALIKSAGATNTSLVTYLVPVTAVLLGVLFLGERLGPDDLAGMAMIVAGVALAQGRLRTGRGRATRPAAR